MNNIKWGKWGRNTNIQAQNHRMGSNHGNLLYFLLIGRRLKTNKKHWGKGSCTPCLTNIKIAHVLAPHKIHTHFYVLMNVPNCAIVFFFYISPNTNKYDWFKISNYSDLLSVGQPCEDILLTLVKFFIPIHVGASEVREIDLLRLRPDIDPRTLLALRSFSPPRVRSHLVWSWACIPIK